MVSWGVNFPHKNCPIPFWFAPSPHHMITSKSLSKPICSSKSYKYDQYDKMTYRLSPYCYIPQANLISRLFTATQLTLDHYQGAASLTRCYSLCLILIWSQSHQEPGFEPRPFRFWMQLFHLLLHESGP